MATIEFSVTLTIRGPVLTKSSAPGAYLVDAPFAVNAENRPYLPGTLVKGRLREALQELHKIAGEELGSPEHYLVPSPELWFGPDHDRGGNRKNKEGKFLPHSTRFFVSDFVMQDCGQEVSRRTRVQIDRDRHAADDQMMLILESPVAPGQNADFSGRIRFEGVSTDPNELKRWVIKGLRWAGAFGSATSVGFGKLTDLKVRHEATREQGENGLDNIIEDRFQIILTSKDLLCITEGRDGENLFESGTDIPGGVLRGAIARQWLRSLGSQAVVVVDGCDPDRPELARQFDKIRFSHARAMQESGSRSPVAVPLSYAKVGEVFRDLARYKGMPAGLGLLKFAIDWKKPEQEHADVKFGRPEVKRELRVRTAIDHERRRAKDKALFALDMVRPDGLQWVTTVDLSSCEKPERVREQLLSLLRDGIRGVGKTKASLAVKRAVPEIVPIIEEGSIRDGEPLRITLQTAAIIADPTRLEGRSRVALLQAYREYFLQKSGNLLNLSHFFASQRLAGGLYLHRRFQKGRSYEPYLLTEAGSVFVFYAVADGGKVAGVVDSWRRMGLPTPDWAVDRWEGADWSTNPYVRENGFGEITVNQVIAEGDDEGGNDA